MTHETRAPYDFNKVTKITDEDQNAPKWLNSAEKLKTFAFVAPNPRKGENPYTDAIRLVIYTSKSGGSNYAALWANSRDGKKNLHGFGQAGGYGYDRCSKAANSAFILAGIELVKPFGGCGDGPTRHAIKVLAIKLGWTRGQIMEF